MENSSLGVGQRMDGCYPLPLATKSVFMGNRSIRSNGNHPSVISIQTLTLLPGQPIQPTADFGMTSDSSRVDANMLTASTASLVPVRICRITVPA